MYKSAIENAVQAERERCAKICETMSRSPWWRRWKNNEGTAEILTAAANNIRLTACEQ